MQITDVIAALSAILDAHGNLIVMHEDDRIDFVVERVEFRPGSDVAWDGTPGFVFPDDDEPGWVEPPHVRVSGHSFVFDGNGGLVAAGPPTSSEPGTEICH